MSHRNCNEIIDLVKAGLSVASIAAQLRLPASIISAAISLFQATGHC
jgi:Protein of unknown function (DUF742)